MVSVPAAAAAADASVLLRRETLLTLEYVLPWLRQWGYDIITLGEAAAISSQGQSDLTVDALEVHNELLGMHTLNSQVGIALYLSPPK